jgi:hypothetical protein
MGRPWEKIFPEMPVKPVIDKIIVISISGPLPTKRAFFIPNIFSNF